MTTDEGSATRRDERRTRRRGRRLLADTTPLRISPAFRRLWWGLGVANLGTQLTVIAVGLEVYDITGSTFSVGVLGLCALVPLILLGLYGGALVDAYDRRKVALVASSVLWVVTLTLAGQAWLGVRSVAVLYALVAVQSAAMAVMNPARFAIIPRLLEPRLVPAANALQTIAWNIALTGGPLLGATLVAAFDYAVAYSVDAVLFTAALWALQRLPPVPPASRAGDDGASPAPVGRRERRTVVGFSSVLDGLRYLATRPNVRMTFLLDLIAMILSFPRVLYPAVGVLYLGGGEATTGALAAAFAIGAVLAGIFSGGLSRNRWHGRMIVWAILAWGASIAGFGAVLVVTGRTEPDTILVPALVAAMVMLALAGASDAVSAVFRQTVLQTATPDELRGRLQGVFIVVVAGGPRLGELTVGAEAAWLGEGWAAIVGGLGCAALVGVLVSRQRRFLRYDARNPQP